MNILRLINAVVCSKTKKALAFYFSKRLPAHQISVAQSLHLKVTPPIDSESGGFIWVAMQMVRHRLNQLSNTTLIETLIDALVAEIVRG